MPSSPYSGLSNLLIKLSENMRTGLLPIACYVFFFIDGSRKFRIIQELDYAGPTVHPPPSGQTCSD